MRKRIQIVVMGGALAAGMPLAHASERVTLSNGFSMDCDHHGMVDGQIRLYLSAGETSYIAVRPGEVTGVETVAAPAPQPAETRPQQAKLNPADLNEMLSAAGQAHNLDIDLLASVVKAESNGNAHAVSHSGARGLMQLMPSTATDLGVEDSFRPRENVRGGSTYLDALLRRYHDNLALALAAYNAGPAAVDKYHGIPPYHETRVYVARVIHEFNRRVEARQMQSRRRASLSTTARTAAQ